MKILLAVDGSPHSDMASLVVRRLAGRRPHNVRLLYVIPPVIPSGVAIEKSITQILKEDGAKMMDVLVRELNEGDSLRVVPKIVESKNVADAILKEADRGRYDLTVVGARGLGPVKAFLLGSVSHRVSRHSKRAVLVARKIAADGPLKILAAVDGSSPSRRALEFLTKLGAPKDSVVHLIHVVEPPITLVSSEFGIADLAANRYYEEHLRKNRLKGHKLLDQWTKKLTPLYGEVDAALMEGSPAGDILRMAKEHSADLVVMGKRGLTGLEKFLLGSVSQKMSAYAPCSVLIVP